MEFPFERGDGAETAHLVTPLREFDVGMIGRSRNDPLGTVDKVNFRGKTTLFSGQKLINFVVIADTGKDINFFEFFREFLFVPFRETSRHNENRITLTSRVEIKDRVE